MRLLKLPTSSVSKQPRVHALGNSPRFSFPLSNLLTFGFFFQHWHSNRFIVNSSIDKYFSISTEYQDTETGPQSLLDVKIFSTLPKFISLKEPKVKGAGKTRYVSAISKSLAPSPFLSIPCCGQRGPPEIRNALQL